MYRCIKEVRPGPDYTLLVRFDDGTSGILDLAPYLDFGVFRRLRDEAEFRRVRVAFDTVAWSCGVDLDPEFVAAKCRPAGVPADLPR